MTTTLRDYLQVAQRFWDDIDFDLLDPTNTVRLPNHPASNIHQQAFSSSRLSQHFQNTRQQDGNVFDLHNNVLSPEQQEMRPAGRAMCICFAVIEETLNKTPEQDITTLIETEEYSFSFDELKEWIQANELAMEQARADLQQLRQNGNPLVASQQAPDEPLDQNDIQWLKEQGISEALAIPEPRMNDTANPTDLDQKNSTPEPPKTSSPIITKNTKNEYLILIKTKRNWAQKIKTYEKTRMKQSQKLDDLKTALQQSDLPDSEQASVLYGALQSVQNELKGEFRWTRWLKTKSRLEGILANDMETIKKDFPNADKNSEQKLTAFLETQGDLQKAFSLKTEKDTTKKHKNK